MKFTALTLGVDSSSLPPMRAFSPTTLFGLGELAPVKRKALTLIYASSLALMMGISFILPGLPAMVTPFGISDSALGLVMTVYTAPAIILAPLFGIVADLYGRRGGVFLPKRKNRTVRF